MDFQGNTCHNIGFRHPRLIKALKEQLDVLPFASRRFTSEVAVAFAEKLCALWPYGPAKVLLGLSGSDAVEMALKLAYVATGRTRTLAFADSWHGAGLGAVWAGGRSAERAGYPEFAGCHHVRPYWDTPRETTQSVADIERAARLSLDDIARRLDKTGGFAALIAEPVKSAPCVPPAWFWPEVRALCDANGTLLIFDEIPGGLGKTGKMFASEHFAAAPDMTVLGKSLGGAAVGVSAVIARAGLDVAGHMAIGHYTHQKNPLLARAGLETLAIIGDENLVARAAGLGPWYREELARAVAGHPYFATATGIGFLAGVELSPLACPPEQRGYLLKALQLEALRLGVNAGTALGRFLSFSPPLVATPDELARSVEIVDRLRRFPHGA